MQRQQTIDAPRLSRCERLYTKRGRATKGSSEHRMRQRPCPGDGRGVRRNAPFLVGGPDLCGKHFADILSHLITGTLNGHDCEGRRTGASPGRTPAPTQQA